MDGHVRWLDYPDEIEKGSLIRFGDKYATVTHVGYLGSDIYYIKCEVEETDSTSFIDIRAHSSAQIETFTKI